MFVKKIKIKRNENENEKNENFYIEFCCYLNIFNLFREKLLCNEEILKAAEEKKMEKY